MYRTTPGDVGSIHVELAPDRGPRLTLVPGNLFLSSSDRRTSTTLTWIRDGVPADGQGLAFLVESRLRPDADGVGKFRGRKIVVAVDIWPAGNH